MKTKLLKRIFVSTLLLSSLASVAPVSADDYDDQVSEAEQQVEHHEQAANSLNNLMAQLTDEVNNTQAALNNLSSDIQRNEQFLEDAVIELEKAQQEMEALQEEIIILEENIENRWGQLEEQARKIQVNGNSTTNIDFILSAESLTDILARVDIVSKVVSTSSQMLEDQIKDQQSVVEKTAETERKIVQQNAIAAELEKTATDLESQKISQEALVAQLQIEQSSIGSERDALIAQRNDALQRVDQIENEREQVRLAIENAEVEREMVVSHTEASSEEEQNTARPATSNSASASAVNNSNPSNSSVHTNTGTSNNNSSATSSGNSSPIPAVKPEPAPEPAPKPTPAPKPAPAPAQKPVSSAPGHVIPYARKYSGTPYLFGGTTPAAFDCSGFTQYVFAEAGKKIPRNSSAQYGAADKISSPEPGDLVFFGTNQVIEHVGIYVGGGRFIGSQYNGVREESLKVGHWSTRVIGYGRY